MYKFIYECTWSNCKIQLIVAVIDRFTNYINGLFFNRAAIVQNQHLAVLAEKLGLDQFMLYAHGSDLCHDFELRHAMANCFEALMGAIFLDTGIEVERRNLFLTCT